MAECLALLVDEVFPHQPVRQWVLSFPFQLRFLFASRPLITGQMLGIVYHVLSMYLVRKAGYSRKTARTGAVTLIQQERYPVSPCMRAWQPGQTSARNWNVCPKAAPPLHQSANRHVAMTCTQGHKGAATR
jgi:hypothetical protein